MKRIISMAAAASLIVAALVFGLVRSQPSQAAVSAVAFAATSATTVHCQIISDHVGGGHAVAQGTCGKGVPIAWKTSLKLTSPSGPCTVAHPTGTSRSFGYSPTSATATVTFTVYPKHGKAAPASKSVTSKPVPNSIDMCQYAPPITTIAAPDSAHPGCTWPVTSTYNVATELYTGGGFACPASWGCAWTTNIVKAPIYQHQLGLNIVGGGQVGCKNRTYAYTGVDVFFRSTPTAPTGCYKTLTYVTSLKLPSNFSGYVWWAPKLYTVTKGAAGETTSLAIPPKGSLQSWSKLPGSVSDGVDPCNLPGMQGWNYNPAPTTTTGG